MAPVTSKSTTWPRATAPAVASTGPSIAGCVFAVRVCSSHAQPVIAWRRPPATLWEFSRFDTCSRSVAEVTWRAPTPLTRTRKRACLTGLASTSSLAVAPKFLTGVAAFTMASASTVATTVPGAGGGGAAGGQVQSTRQAPGQSALAVPSHCSLGWLMALSPQTGAGAQVQSARQRPGQAASAVPSHCSLAWLTRLSPQRGAGGQVQLARHAPGHRTLSVPSHCSVAWFTLLSPHTGQAKCGVPSTPTQEPAAPDAGTSTSASVALPVPSLVTATASPGWPFGMKSCGWSSPRKSRRAKESGTPAGADPPTPRSSAVGRTPMLKKPPSWKAFAPAAVCRCSIGSEPAPKLFVLAAVKVGPEWHWVPAQLPLKVLSPSCCAGVRVASPSCAWSKRLASETSVVS